MRIRPVRPNIYLPVVRFGVADSDWFTVLLVSCAGYLVPVPFGITLLYVPLQMWTWLLATAGCIAFFNYIRIGRRPYWLQHKLKALVFPHRQYRTIPNGKKRAFKRSWIVDEVTRPSSQGSLRSTDITVFLIENSNRLQEVLDRRWNPFSLNPE